MKAIKAFAWFLGYCWAAPCTLFGLIRALCDGGIKHMTWRDDWSLHSIVAAGGMAHTSMVANRVLARTWGFFVEYRDDRCYRVGANQRHELDHVFWAAIFGPFWPLAYWLADVVAIARGQKMYWDNWFEKSARAHEALAD